MPPPRRWRQAPNLGELALDLTLRPRGPLPLRRGGGRGRHRLADDVAPDDGRRPPDRSGHSTSPPTRRRASGCSPGPTTTCSARRPRCSWPGSPATPWRGWPRPSSASSACRSSCRAATAGVPTSTSSRSTAELTQTLLPNFVSTLDAVLRRQIVAVAERMWSTDPERSVVTVQRTVGFVDLVGYTTADGVLVPARAHRRPGRVRPAHLRDRGRAATGRSSRRSATRRCSSPRTPRTPAGSRST